MVTLAVLALSTLALVVALIDRRNARRLLARIEEAYR